MPDFGVVIDGSDRRIILRFAEFPVYAHDRLYAALVKIEQRLEAAILAQAPVGQSGALRNMIGGRVYDHQNRIAAVVGVRVKDAENPQAAARKAAALEYGSRGRPVTVRAHDMGLDHFWSRLVEPRTEVVAAYSRVPAISPQMFLRGPAMALREEAITEMRAAVAAAVRDAQV